MRHYSIRLWCNEKFMISEFKGNALHAGGDVAIRPMTESRHSPELPREGHGTTKRTHVDAYLVRLVSTAVTAMLGLSMSVPAAAGGVSDFFHSIDLNEYSLGGFYFHSSSYYVGVDDFNGVFPLPTSYSHSIMNDYAFYVRDGEFSLRKIFDNGWELAGTSQLQTLGYGSSDSPALEGMERRDWTIQGGISVGRQFGPIRIDAGAQTDLLGEHGGQEYKLEFALPWEFDNWYLIPEFEIRYQSEELINHYFGVTEEEARPGRPAYQPGGAVTYSPSITMNWRFHERWYATATIVYDILPDEIIDSPITIADNGIRAVLGIAYDAPAFVALDRDRVQEWPGIEVSVGAFFAQTTSKVNVGRFPDTAPPTLEDSLGLDQANTTGLIGALWRLNNFHALEIGYFNVSRSGTADVPVPTPVGPVIFPIGATVDSSFDTKVLKLGYAFSLFHDNQKELSLFGGVHLSDISYRSSAGNLDVSASTTTTMPVVGARLNGRLSKRLSAGATIDYYNMDFNQISGRMINFGVFGEYLLTDKLSIRGEYRFYRQVVDSADPDFPAQYAFEYSGPAVYLVGRFL